MDPITIILALFAALVVVLIVAIPVMLITTAVGVQFKLMRFMFKSRKKK